MLNTDDWFVINMRLKHGTIDIYTYDGLDIERLLQDNSDGLIVFTEHEYGCASHLAMSTIIEMGKPQARILTHLISNNVFNQTEEFEHIGWELYFVDGYTILNISRWPQTSLVPPEQAQTTWIHIYPPIRDILEVAMMNGHTNIRFLGSTTIHDALDNDIFKIQKSSDITVYDFKGDYAKRGDGEDLFFTPPTWLFPYIAHLLGYESSVAVLSGHNEDERVDIEAGKALMVWLDDNLLLPITPEKLQDTANDIENHYDRSDKLRSDIETIIRRSDTPKNSMLWG